LGIIASILAKMATNRIPKAVFVLVRFDDGRSGYVVRAKECKNSDRCTFLPKERVEVNTECETLFSSIFWFISLPNIRVKP